MTPELIDPIEQIAVDLSNKALGLLDRKPWEVTALIAKALRAQRAAGEAEAKHHTLPDDYEWARERVVRMTASALVDARVYGRKLLKGFGYPDEIFGRAQDARALQILLNAAPNLSVLEKSDSNTLDAAPLRSR